VWRTSPPRWGEDDARRRPQRDGQTSGPINITQKHAPPLDLLNKHKVTHTLSHTHTHTHTHTVVSVCPGLQPPAWYPSGRPLLSGWLMAPVVQHRGPIHNSHTHTHTHTQTPGHAHTGSRPRPRDEGYTPLRLCPKGKRDALELVIFWGIWEAEGKSGSRHEENTHLTLLLVLYPRISSESGRDRGGGWSEGMRRIRERKRRVIRGYEADTREEEEGDQRVWGGYERKRRVIRGYVADTRGRGGWSEGMKRIREEEEGDQRRGSRRDGGGPDMKVKAKQSPRQRDQTQINMTASFWDLIS